MRYIVILALLMGLSACDDGSALDNKISDVGRTIQDVFVRDLGMDTQLGVIDAMALVDVSQADVGQDMFLGECRVDSDCDDGLFCNGRETCSNNRCYANPLTPCDDGVGCTRDLCDEAAQTCSTEADENNCPEQHLCDLKLGCFPIVPCENDSDCDDGSACNGVESCFMNRCAPGRPTVCNDEILCTVDVCIDETGQCEFLPAHGRCIETQLCSTEAGCIDRPPCERDDDCDDGSFCNGLETCDLETGACEPGAAPDVDDGIPCTIDVCSDQLAMVVHTPTPARCSDGLFCNGAEVCHPVMGCQPGTPPALSDGIGCTDDTCNEELDFIEHTPRDESCDDGLFCNGDESCHPIDGCVVGEPPVVNDGIGCTIDACSEVERRVIHAPNNERCDDGLFCNGRELCDAERDCQNGLEPQLDDGLPCTIDECDELNDRVTHTPDHGLCNDRLFCNGRELCEPIIGCVPGVPPVVDDGVLCTTDRCDEETDRVVHQPENQSCDDGLFCNGSEVCDPIDGCAAGAPPMVDDGVGCTLDRCDEAIDRIVHHPNHALCNDGLFCNGLEMCDELRGCEPGEPPSLDDGIPCTRDTCDELNDVILNEPVTAACDDGLFCNGQETCNQALGCQPGQVPVLDDNIGCTEDVCDEALDRVVHQPNDQRCDNGSICDGFERCDPALDCQAGVAPQDGTACGEEVGAICVDGRCGESRCGDGFFDAATGEACDDGNLVEGDGCNTLCQQEGNEGHGMEGSFRLVDDAGDQTSLRYSCSDLFFGLTVISINVESFQFTTGDDQLVIRNLGQTPPPLNQEPAPRDLNFSASATVSGGCTETYRLFGVFEDMSYERFSGQFEICFEGDQCAITTCQNCTTINVRGVRVDEAR